MSDFWWGYFIGIVVGVLCDLFITPHVRRWLLKRYPALRRWLQRDGGERGTR